MFNHIFLNQSFKDFHINPVGVRGFCTTNDEKLKGKKASGTEEEVKTKDSEALKSGKSEDSGSNSSSNGSKGSNSSATGSTLTATTSAKNAFSGCQVSTTLLGSIKGIEDKLSLGTYIADGNGWSPRLLQIDSFLKNHTTFLGSIGNVFFQFLGDTLASKFLKEAKPGLKRLEFGFTDNIHLFGVDLVNCHTSHSSSPIVKFNANGFMNINHVGLVTQGNLGSLGYYSLINYLKDSGTDIDLSEDWRNIGVQINGKFLKRFISADQQLQIEHCSDKKITAKLDFYHSTNELAKCNVYIADFNVKFIWALGLKARYSYSDVQEVGQSDSSWGNILSYPMMLNLSGKLVFGFNNCIFSPSTIMKTVLG